MTSDNDVREAERNLLVSLLHALADKRVIGAVVLMVLALCGWVSTRVSELPQTFSANVAADPCYVTGRNVTNANQQACIAILCASLAHLGVSCKPTPQPGPTPTPTVVVDAGPTPAPVIVGGGSLPKCKAQALMASPEQIEKRRATVKPRVKIPGIEKLISKDAPRFLGTAYPLIMWRFNNAFCGDQGPIGMCVSAAANGVSVTQPFAVTFPNADALNASFLAGYKWITANDPFPGAYPPADTGSDTLTGCKWLVKMGYAKSCRVLSGKDQVIAALEQGPIMSGINWPNTGYVTASCGQLDMRGDIDGGHDRELVGYLPANTPPLNLPEDYFIEQNSWGQDFGVRDDEGHGGLQLMKASDEFSVRLDADFVQPVR